LKHLSIVEIEALFEHKIEKAGFRFGSMEELRDGG
jgi:hypothetical protein